MRCVILLVLHSFFVAASGGISTRYVMTTATSDEIFDQELLIIAKLSNVLGCLVDLAGKNDEQIQEFSSSMNNLMKSVDEHPKITEQKVANFTTNTVDFNKSFLRSFDRLVEIIDADKKCSKDDALSELYNMTTAIAHNQKASEEKIIQVTTSLAANYSGLSTSVQRLHDFQKTIDEKIANLTSNIIANVTRISNRFDSLEKSYQQIISNITGNSLKCDKLLERIDKLEKQSETMAGNQISLDTQINLIKHNLSEVANRTREIVDNLPIPSCKTPSKSGVYRLQSPNITVYCEMESVLGGSWLVIQQQIEDFKLNFNRSWFEYRDGFGVIGKYEEFWLGNEAIHQITSSGEYELAIVFKDIVEDYEYARFSQFHVAGEDNKYRLTVGGHSGTLWDGFSNHNSMQFSTYDSDNDKSISNCANHYGGGWWYNDCGWW